MHELSTLYVLAISDAMIFAWWHPRVIDSSSSSSWTGGKTVRAAAAVKGPGSTVHRRGSGSCNDRTGTSHFDLGSFLGKDRGYMACVRETTGPISETLLSSASNPRFYNSCAAGGRFGCMYHALSNTAWWLDFTNTDSISRYRILWSEAVYPKKMLVKLWWSSLLCRSPDCLTHTWDPNILRYSMSGLWP